MPERAQAHPRGNKCGDVATFIFQRSAQARSGRRGPEKPRSLQIPQEERRIRARELPEHGIVRNLSEH
jgi:hypothetical protein